MRQIAESTVITDLCSVIATSNPVEDIFGQLKGNEDSYILRRGEKTKPPRGNVPNRVTREAFEQRF